MSNIGIILNDFQGLFYSIFKIWVKFTLGEIPGIQPAYIGYSREFINSVKFYLDKMQPIICSNKSKEQLTNKDRIKEHFITDKQTKTDKL